MKRSLIVALTAVLVLAGCDGSGPTTSNRVQLNDGVVVAFTMPKTSEVGEIFAEDAAKDVAMAVSQVIGKEVAFVSEGEVAPTAKTVIYIGDTEAAKAEGIDVKALKDVEAVMRAKGNRIYLAARTGMGVNNGCMEFLQRYCDYWFVSVWGDAASYKKNPQLSVPEFDFVLRPAFSRIEVHAGNNYPVNRKDYQKRFKSKPRWFGKRYPFERRCRTFYVNSEADGANRVSAQTPCNHSQFSYLPPEKYFKEHPEWYSMDEKGKRRAVANKGSQFCYTNKEALEEIWKNMRAKVIADRKAKPTDYPRIYDFTQMDDCRRLCLCPECKKITAKGSDTALQLNLVNELARRMKKEFPDNIIRIFAYVSTGLVPTDDTKVEPNVMIWICDLYGFSDHERPLGEKPINDACKKIIDDWFKLTSNVEIWDYMLSSPRYYVDYPEVNFKAIACDARYFRDNGVRRFFIQNSTPSYSCWGLNQFLLGQMYFNPDVDGDMLMDRYCGVFGEGKAEMRAAFDWLIKRMDECGGVSVDAWSKKQVAFRNLKTWETFLRHLEAAYPLVPEGSPKGMVAQLLVDTCREVLPQYKQMTDRAAELKRLKPLVAGWLDEALKIRLDEGNGGNEQYRGDIEAMLAMLDVNFNDMPECFNGVAPQDVIALEYHATNPHYRKGMVQDPKSSAGMAFQHAASNEVVTVTCGTYDFETKAAIRKFYFKLKRGDDDYHWYCLGRTPVTRLMTLWMTNAWTPHFDLGRYWHTCDGVADDNFFEIWVSARRDTPKNLLYLDRVLMRRVVGEK